MYRVVSYFLRDLHIAFRRHRAAAVDLTYHFTFTGAEPPEATIVIRHGTLQVERGLIGSANIHITADSNTWIAFLRQEKNLVWALLWRKIRLRGSPILLRRFGECFAV